MPQESPELKPAELQALIVSGLSSYRDKSSFECFALIMGKAQILEYGLKNLLARHCAVEQAQMEKWTLGVLARELKTRGLRSDYVTLLKEFVSHRNYMAHEMLVNNAIFRSMAADISERFEFRQLQDPAYELERLLILHDWCEENDAWGFPR
jgi:hypothetical protein